MTTRIAGVADLDAATGVLADGFFADPVWGWAFDDASSRRAQQTAWFRLVVAQAIERGAVRIGDGGEAVSVWVPPGLPELDEARELELEATLRHDCGARAEFMFELFDAFERNHPHDRPHWYLSLLATADRHRGHGHGMRLLAADLAELDRLGEPAYLESTNPGNLRRYESAGFRRFGEFTLPGGPVVTTMWRDPHPVDA